MLTSAELFSATLVTSAAVKSVVRIWPLVKVLKNLAATLVLWVVASNHSVVVNKLFTRASFEIRMFDMNHMKKVSVYF